MQESEHAAKSQFNVHLPVGLVRAIKHQAIDEGTSPSALVERVMTGYLETAERDG